MTLKNLTSFILPLCLCLGRVATADAENWPGWRGPNRNGVTSETRIPLKWSDDEGVLWKTALPGLGISNPIVWDDRVIVTASDGKTLSELHVICMSRDSGEELWHLRLWGTAPTRHHGYKSSMASPAPVTDGNHVFAFFGTGDVFCASLDGRLVWHRSLAAEYGKFENRFAAASSPLLFRDTVVLQCDHYGDSYVMAIDKATGANRWKLDRPDNWLSWASPVLVPAGRAGRYELIVSGSQKLDAIDPLTGRLPWTVRGMRRECIPTPVYGHGLVYAVSGHKGPTLAVRPGGRGDVTESHVVWSNTRGAPFVPSAILIGDYYYLVDDHGIGTCLDAHTGKLFWQKRFGGEFTASPVAADGKIYFIDEAGTTRVIASGLDVCRELARNPLGEAVFASPAISQGRLFIRTVKRLYCIGRSDSQP